MWKETMNRRWVFMAFLVCVLLFLKSEAEGLSNFSPSASPPTSSSAINGVSSKLQYNFYRDKCPEAENIVRSTMNQIFSEDKKAPPQLLRLVFHDCFIQGCDASVLLDESKGNSNSSMEKQAIPNKTLKGFDFIEAIKEELESACPGVVSCADTLVLATRDGILLAGGPFYPLLTGRKDSEQSFPATALAEIPRPDGNISETLRLFGLRGFNARETVALLGGHNIGKIGCEFIRPRLDNFQGTGKPDQTMSSQFMNEIRTNCLETNSSAAPPATSSTRSSLSSRLFLREEECSCGMGTMSYYQGLSASISSGSALGSGYYQSLVNGRGLLFADQQLMEDERTAEVVRIYATDGARFRVDFARSMLKMSSLGVLTDTQGQIRLTCSTPVDAS